MPHYATRRIRNTAAVLMLSSGLSHIAQLWFEETDTITLLTALTGMYYLVLALGLSGQSRFTVWITALSVAAAGAVRGPAWDANAPDPVLTAHLAVDAVVAALCVFILYRTRFADTD
jgi:hypothetical protein